MFRLVALLCIAGACGQVVETMEDYAQMGRLFADWAKTATPTDSETLRNVLAAGAQGGSAGCPGCSFLQQEKEAVAQVRVVSGGDDSSLLKNIKVNVEKSASVPKDIMALVEKYEQKMNEKEQQMLESALHSIPKKTSFLGASSSNAPFEVRIGVGSKEFPSFFKAVREMESLRTAAEERIRAELVSMLEEPKTSFIQNSGSAKALAETVADLQRKAYGNPKFGAEILAEINRQSAPKQKASFIQKAVPEFNVKYEFPVSEAHKATSVSFESLDDMLSHQEELVNKLSKSAHSQFLTGGQYDRRTQAPMVWLHLNDGHSASFVEVPQAVTPAVDLYIEQGN